MTQRFSVDKLAVSLYANRQEMGKQAAKEAGDYLRQALEIKDRLNIVFAAAPSQTEFLDCLSKEPGIDWGRIYGFHMDEYIGLPTGSARSFSYFLKTNIFEKAPFAGVNYINGAAPDPQAECERYGDLLKENGIDIVFMGIGENGHIAFNDPGVAKFHDQKVVKTVQLDEICRHQQVNDKCFPTLEDVPKEAITLTVPTLLSAKKLFCIVPSSTKAKAVRDTLEGPVSESCPASILRIHEDASLYLEKDSARLLTQTFLKACI